jgi:O-antigen ligase
MVSERRLELIPIYAVLLVTIVVIPSLLDPFNLPKLFFITLGACLSLAIFLEQIWKSRHGLHRNVFFLTIAFLISLSISSLASNQETYRTLIGTWGRNNGFLAYFSLSILFLTLSTMKSIGPSHFLIKSLTILGLLLGFYGLLQYRGLDLFAWENPDNKIILTFGNSNFASAFLALSSIATLSLILRSNKTLAFRLVLGTSFLMQIFLVRRSGALQGLVALTIGSGILFGLYLSFSKRMAIKRFAYAWWGVMLLSAATSVFGLLGSGPLSATLNPNLRSLQDRYFHWISALKMLKDNLLFGVGIDSFGDYYRNYRLIESIELRGNASSTTNNAHNTFMQLGATGGLILLIPYLLLIVFTAYRSLIALKSAEDKLLVSATFSIWVAFQIQSLVSIDQLGLVVWGWASAGSLIAMSYLRFEPKQSAAHAKSKKKNKQIVKQKKDYIPTALTLVVAIIPASLIYSSIWHEASLRNHIVKMTKSENLESLRSNGALVVEIATNSKQPELRIQAVNYLLTVELSDEALKLSKLNNKEFVFSWESWNSTALIYEWLGRYKEAIYYRNKTVELDPLNIEVKQLLERDRAAG